MICKHLKAKVLNSRPTEGVRRYRKYKCLDCGELFSTMEVECKSVGRGNKGGYGKVFNNMVKTISEDQKQAILQLIDVFKSELIEEENQ